MQYCVSSFITDILNMYKWMMELTGIVWHVCDESDDSPRGLVRRTILSISNTSNI